MVQPNAASPNADTPIGTVTGTGVPIAPGSQLLQFNDPTGTNLLPGTAPVVLRIELRRRADLNRLPFLPSTDTNRIVRRRTIHGSPSITWTFRRASWHSS